jgi:methionine-rich copper-binding protein CopC
MLTIRKVTSFAAACALAIGASSALSSPAFAHAEYANSNPAKGAKLTKQPSHVTVVFDDKLVNLANSNLIVVTNAAKQHVEVGKTKLNGGTVSVALKPGLPNGKYTVTYKVLSDDGHPVTGSYTFFLK